MTTKKRVAISVVLLLVIASVGFIVLRMFEEKPPTGVEVTQYDEGDIDFAIAKDWTVELYGNKQFRITHNDTKNGRPVILLDASENESYDSVLDRVRGGISEPKVNGVFFAGLQGQQLEGIPFDTDGNQGYLVSTLLDKKGKVVSISLSASNDANLEKYIEDYRVLLSSLEVGVDPQKTQIVKRDEEGREIVPVFVRDGINSRKTYSDGTYTISGYIAFPNPCYELTTKAKVIPGEEEDLVFINFTATEQQDSVCIQVITQKDFSVSFEASENARIQGQYNTLPVQLLFNL